MFKKGSLLNKKSNKHVQHETGKQDRIQNKDISYIYD